MESKQAGMLPGDAGDAWILGLSNSYWILGKFLRIYTRVMRLC
jgi:hypothetical protein